MTDKPPAVESLPAGSDDMPWVDPPSLPPTDLPYDDGEKMESPWHAHSLSIIAASTIASRGGAMADYYVGTSMFVYYSWKQVRNLDYKGPDVFFVEGAEELAAGVAKLEAELKRLGEER
jgi:hypothetical protein